MTLSERYRHEQRVRVLVERHVDIAELANLRDDEGLPLTIRTLRALIETIDLLSETDL